MEEYYRVIYAPINIFGARMTEWLREVRYPDLFSFRKEIATLRIGCDY